jgi:replicative DNA helicase
LKFSVDAGVLDVEKLLPQNTEAECGVLGSIIIDPEAIVQVADFLQPEDFYRDAHRTIYEVIIQLYEQQEPADFITICDELERRNRLEDVGGASYITSLINQVPTSGNVEFYGRIVERTAILRRLIHAAGQIAATAYEEVDAEVALDKAEQLIFGITQKHARADFSALRDLLADYMQKLDQLHEHRGTIVGVPTGFTDLDRLTGGLQKSDLIILAARPAVGKCLAAWSLVDDSITGERLTIEECVKRKMPQVHGISEEGKVRVANISDWIDSGVQPCYRVQTHLGRMIEVTGHHPFLTVRGWKPLYDLKVGDHIAVPTKVECFGTDESWPIEKVRLLAYFIAEGGLTGGSPAFTNTDPVIVDDFKQIIATHYPVCSLRQERITYTVTQKKDEYSRQHIAILPKNPVTLWLKELGLMDKLAKDKFFPSCVWKWSKRYLAEFLRALMSCDGSIYKSSSGELFIEFTVASPKLATDLSHAFLRFGIISRYYKSGPNAWRVALTHPESIKRYQNEIGWIGGKTTRFAEYVHKITSRGSNYGHAPKETWMIIRADAQQQGLSLTRLAYKVGQTDKQGRYAGYHAHTSQSISRNRLTAFADALDNPALRRIASPDIYWDKITSIEYIGEHQVYDLTVPDGANFIAQDVFVHNTSMALSLAHNAAVKYQQTVAIFSLEMSKEQLLQRLLSMDAAVDQQRLRTGWIEDDEWERIVNSMETLAQANIWIDDTAGISTMEVRSKARRLQAEHGVDLIIIDYLQLMQSSPGERRRQENRVQEVSEISRNLKGLARELNVPVMALAQLSRTVEQRQSKVPQLSDLRESGCLASDTPVYLPDLGTYRPIQDLVGQTGFNVLALDTETWQLEPRPVTNAFATGCKPVYKMTTRMGRSIRATANHKFLTIQGWKRLDELTTDMRIAVPRHLPGPIQATMSDDELALLGHLIGDGCMLPTHAIQYTTVDYGLAELVVNLASQVFEDRVAPRIQRDAPKNKTGGWYQVFFPPTYQLTHGVYNPVAQWLRELGIFGLRSHEKYVPEKVFAQPAASIALFLRHLWSTDGCVHLSHGKSHFVNIYYASSSIRLAQNVQSLLLRLGVNAALSRNSQGNKGRDQYHVRISGKAEVELFLKAVGGLGENKALHHAAITELLAGRPGKTNRDVIPREVWQYLEMLETNAQVVAAGEQTRSRPKELLLNSSEYTRNISRERAARVASSIQSDQLALLARSDVYWDEILSIEPDGEAEVYDLTVDALHDFIAEDVVVKNSIEQDSDIVMFIYREDVYNPETERKNIADIIVAKHRNGPVGEVSLFFQASQTRFRDLEVTPPVEEE